MPPNLQFHKMCDCLSSVLTYPPHFAGITTRGSVHTARCPKHYPRVTGALPSVVREGKGFRLTPLSQERLHLSDASPTILACSDFTSFDKRNRSGGFQSLFHRNSFGSPGTQINLLLTRNPRVLPTNENEYEPYDELGSMVENTSPFHFETAVNLPTNIDIDDRSESGSNSNGKSAPSTTAAFLEYSHQNGSNAADRLKDEDLVRTQESSDGVHNPRLDHLEKSNSGRALRSGRQLMRRSNMIAKQVISVESALSLGFVSQLWVDTDSWMVLVVEVRPNLLSGELERLFLEDVIQVGDVVLVEDESVMENECKLVRLESLVGYNVVTPGRQSIGKVRGYDFDINSGAIESLEFDSFGISVIPSSLVSTYALFVDDVLEVVSDTVVVHEAAASRVQRLTKGFWGTHNVGRSIDELRQVPNPERKPVQVDSRRGRQRRYGSQKLRRKMKESTQDWELPMDYL